MEFYEEKFFSRSNPHKNKDTKAYGMWSKENVPHSMLTFLWLLNHLSLLILLLFRGKRNNKKTKKINLDLRCWSVMRRDIRAVTTALLMNVVTVMSILESGEKRVRAQNLSPLEKPFKPNTQANKTKDDITMWRTIDWISSPRILVSFEYLIN